jgi:hypothetical protein
VRQRRVEVGLEGVVAREENYRRQQIGNDTASSRTTKGRGDSDAVSWRARSRTFRMCQSSSRLT